MSIYSQVKEEGLGTGHAGAGLASQVAAYLERGMPLDEAIAVRLAELFSALSDPNRLRIVSLLSSSELCVGDLADALGMSQSAVSHQLRTLRDRRLVRWRREGRQIYYSLDDEHVADLYLRGLDHVTHP